MKSQYLAILQKRQLDSTLYFLEYYGLYTLLFLIGIWLLLAFLSKRRKDYHSHWNTLIDNFSFSTKEFYDLLKKELQAHGIEGIQMHEVSLSTGGALSEKRVYLRIEWNNVLYDICASPFGHGFYISWWLFLKTSFGEILIRKIPFLGGWLARKCYPVTYHSIDTASMFMSYAQSSVVKVIDDISEGKGIRGLTEQERKPQLRDLLKR